MPSIDKPNGTKKGDVSKGTDYRLLSLDIATGSGEIRSRETLMLINVDPKDGSDMMDLIFMDDIRKIRFNWGATEELKKFKLAASDLKAAWEENKKQATKDALYG